MSDYDFSRLSHADFEELIHDLLAADWGVDLEGFKTGRDGGIDLRFIAADGGRTIVQCKHYPATPFATMLSKLKATERAKIRKLAPDRYVLVTSMGLTPDNKAAIAEALHPFIRGEDNIIGGTEVEHRLRKHPEVAKAHYKLWLTSTAVMERVLHAAEHARTDVHIQKIIRKLPLFVRNDAFPRALAALDEHRMVVISGAPGIGKSTLADLLLYTHVEDGFIPAVITKDFAEGHVLTRPGKRMLFYFDDFLGETYLGDRPEYLGRNEDRALVDFIDFVQQSADHRFILTTREHILISALQRSERLRHSGIADNRCVVELTDYPKAHRARMLYNHLYFSELPVAYKSAMLTGDFFLSVVDHEHFNPRVIEWLSTFKRLKNVPPQDYPAHVTRVLDDPEEIWRHAYEQEISTAARSALVVLYSYNDDVDLEEFEAAWASYDGHCAVKYNYSNGPNAFRDALKELDGSFLRYADKRAQFLNPSVRDFIATVITASANIALDIVASAIRFRQVADLWDSADEEDGLPGLKPTLLKNIDVVAAAYRRLPDGPTTKYYNTPTGRIGRYLDYAPSSRIRQLIQMADEIRSPMSIEVLRDGLSHMPAARSRGDLIVESIVQILVAMKQTAWVKDNGGWPMLEPLIALLLKMLPNARASGYLSLLDAIQQGLTFRPDVLAEVNTDLDALVDDGFSDERRDCTTSEEMNDLKEVLLRIQTRHGKNLAFEISALDEAIEEAERETNEEDQDSSGEAMEVARSAQEPIVYDEDEIRALFGTLLG